MIHSVYGHIDEIVVGEHYDDIVIYGETQYSPTTIYRIYHEHYEHVQHDVDIHEPEQAKQVDINLNKRINKRISRTSHECCICMETTNNVKLNCHHENSGYCSGCIQKMCVRNIVKCPLCRTETKI